MSKREDFLNNLGFIGRYYTDTGLYYFATRWYDASTGRFLEMAPVLSEAGLMNMYEYCGNNPANVTDRYGEWIIEDVFGVTLKEFLEYGVMGKEPEVVKTPSPADTEPVKLSEEAKKNYSSNSKTGTGEDVNLGAEKSDTDLIKRFQKMMLEESEKLRKEYGIIEVKLIPQKGQAAAGAFILIVGVPITVAGGTIIGISVAEGPIGGFGVVHGGMMMGIGIEMIGIGSEMIKTESRIKWENK